MSASRTSGYQANRVRQKSAPLGVKIICVLGVIGAFFSFVVSIAFMGQGGPFALAGLLVMGLTVAQLIVLYGLWTVQEWGWKWGMITYGLSALLALIGAEIFGLLVNLVIVGYLFTKADYYHS